MVKLIVASHRRSGTHLTIDAIINNLQIFKHSPAISKVTLDHLSAANQWDLTPEVLQRRIDGKPAVLKTHAHGNIQAFFLGDEKVKSLVRKIFAESKIIYVHRDGRDVLVSLYYYEKNYDQSLKQKTFSDYLKQPNSFDIQTYPGEMDRVTYWVYHVSSWLQKSNIFVVSYDDLQNEYVATLKKIADFIEEPLNAEIHDVRRQGHNNGLFTKLKGRLLNKMGKVKYSSIYFRKGVSGDWKNHFSAADLQFFEERASELNHSLGYATDHL
ncbi:MAG: sulfotransferase domain-containing protein [Anaerolineales bacterium]|nr:sulfotransferase domain-containing protein [Anaerolineales bacterium]